MNTISINQLDQQEALITYNMPIVRWYSLNKALWDILGSNIPYILDDVEPYFVLMIEIDEKLDFLPRKEREELKRLTCDMITAINRSKGVTSNA